MVWETLAVIRNQACPQLTNPNAQPAGTDTYGSKQDNLRWRRPWKTVGKTVQPTTYIDA